MNRLTLVDWANGHTDSFIYYKDGELNQAQYGNFNRTVTSNLDNAGNRTSVVDNNTTTAYAPNTINEYNTVGGSSVTNGPDHQITGYNNVAYTYANDEHLVSATNGGNSYSLAYDALGRCVNRTLNNNTSFYLYDGEKPVVEFDSTGAVTARNLYGKGIDEILMRTVPANNWTLYYQHNHEGSVTLVTNASGGVIEKYRYDAFGAPTFYDANWNQVNYSTFNNRFLFTGREYAAANSTGYSAGFNFYEYRARAYNPTLGRFMSEDPKGFDAGDYNLFRYCHNDPEDLTDPMGLEQDWAQTGAPVSGNHVSTEMVQEDRAYNFIMGLMQRQFNSAISAGLVGYQQSSAWSASQAIGGLTMGTVRQNGSPGLDQRLSRFGIPDAIRKDEQFADKFTKENPRYNGGAIVGALKRALGDDRIVPGQSKDFNGPKNVFSTYHQIIHVNLASHPRGDLIPALLAHEGQHLLDPVMTKQNWLSLETRGFQVEHGFANVMHVIDTNPRTAAEIVKAYGGD